MSDSQQTVHYESFGRSEVLVRHYPVSSANIVKTLGWLAAT